VEYGAPKVLRSTTIELRNTLGGLIGKTPTELKYSHSAGKYVGQLLPDAVSRASYDSTVLSSHRVWDKGSIAFTTSAVSIICESCFHRGVQSKGRPDPDFPNWLRARSVVSLLGPLFTYDSDETLEVAIVFDETIWKKSVEQFLGKNMETISDINNVSLRPVYENSKKIPGLQLADLVAGTTRDYLNDSNNGDAFDFIQRHTVHRFSKKRPDYVPSLQEYK